ncbi:SEFIR domain-containing protein [Novipirellula artificiosorum]|uniref:SEFIR domain protein n=1 Tax=Novipirellula artificiosorum TaxID=2528016 RepID=A0A5C6DDP1_9BACT|nr:SEFIR domain-containing protein [Novipirellula artificiosorum]TWU34910.1 SEFIR domain protein [Novipirellula artificiosorum]
MSENQSLIRKVFVSYAHTNEDHVEWVIDLATSLQADGIEVVLDQWDLREGQDANVFMEQMVTDESIDRILMVSDANYAAKADKREGGVGTESQIISAELYKQVGQTKFVAILRERDKDDQACLPVFYGSRIYIDMCDEESFSRNYERLVRHIFDKPLNVKPPLGKAPAFIISNGLSSVICIRSSRRFCDVLITGRGNPAAAFDQFAKDLVVDLEAHRMSLDRDAEESWPDDVLDSIEKMRPIRDALIDVVAITGSSVYESWLLPAIVALLEKTANFAKILTKPNAGIRAISQDNFRFFAQEAFLSVIGILICKRRYDLVNRLFCADYFIRDRHDEESINTERYDVFHDPAITLEEMCNQKLESKWISFTGNLIFKRATHPELPALQLIQADAISLLHGMQHHGQWPPTVSIHGRYHQRLPLFDSVVTTGNVGGLGEILGIDSVRGILDLLESDEMRHFYSGGRYWRTCYSDGSIFALEDLRSYR